MIGIDSKYRRILDQRKGELRLIGEQQKTSEKRCQLLREDLENSEKAQAIIQEVAKLTQEELRYHIGELVSLALAAVFDDPYTFELEFVTRRNQTEVDLFFVRDGMRVSPLSSSGCGAVDIAALALRISLWSLKNPRTRGILFLDEPLKFLSREYQTKASSMIKMLSKRLNVQIIMVTHSPELIEQADKIHTFSIDKGVSKVR